MGLIGTWRLCVKRAIGLSGVDSQANVSHAGCCRQLRPNSSREKASQAGQIRSAL